MQCLTKIDWYFDAKTAFGMVYKYKSLHELKSVLSCYMKNVATKYTSCCYMLWQKLLDIVFFFEREKIWNWGLEKYILYAGMRTPEKLLEYRYHQSVISIMHVM